MIEKLLVVLLCLGLVGCETMAQKINSVELGMSKKGVINIMGEPISTSATEGTEFLHYSLWQYGDSLGISGKYVPYFVSIKNGKVISFGREGDFDTAPASNINLNVNNVSK